MSRLRLELSLQIFYNDSETGKSLKILSMHTYSAVNKVRKYKRTVNFLIMVNIFRSNIN